MKWVTVRRKDDERPGIVIDGAIHVLPGTDQLIDLLGDGGEKLVDAGELAQQKPAEVIAYAEADLAAPLRPTQIRDTLLFLQHLKNARGGAELEPEWSQIPAFYFGNTASVTGPNDPVEIFPGSEWFDCELEVASIIGRQGSNLCVEEAEDYIAGFMIFNDWSARDLQQKELVLNIGQGKGKDGANTFGPMFVTSDELEPYRSGNSYSLKAEAYVNDEKFGEGMLDQMDWTFGEIVSFASRGTKVMPGDAICSGTVPTCCLAEHFAVAMARSLAPRDDDQPPPADSNQANFRGWLQPGDVVRLDVELLGSQHQEVLPSVPVHRLRSGY
ncbi:MAG: fumarylacetoacetate hydrolase family protein [Pseudomonadota bacterium]|nr:fumarylacetoacetate hydrolase family protein [Pseudomonadota bacterium]